MNITPHRSRGIYLLPNLFTIGSIFAGFFSIVSSLNGKYDIAATAIFVAMIMDTIDGKIARLTNTMTSFGAQFDSMADMVSFAVAPAFLAYTCGLYSLGKLGWIAAFIYVVAVALRLARFNTQPDSADKRYFQGLPSPAAAAIVSSLAWIYFDFEVSGKTTASILAIVTIIVGILMVSNIRYRSFKDFSLKNTLRFAAMLAVVLIVVLITIDPEKVFFTIFTGYACSGPIATIWGLQQKKRWRKSHPQHKHE